MKKKDEENEHSLEMHLPYIKKLLGNSDFKLVPVMVGNTSYKNEEYYAEIFKKYFEDENTIFIVSSDFCHWGKNFDYFYY